MNTKRYAELFRAEARERLVEMNTSLLAIERGAGADRIAELFRAVHTMKGMSAAMGYEPVRDLSHSLETLLDKLRREPASVTPAVIDALFDAVDALESATVAVCRNADAKPDVSGIIGMLDSISATDEAAEFDAAALQTMEWPAMRIPAATPPLGMPSINMPAAVVPATVVVPAATVAPMPAPGELAQRNVRVDAKRLDTLMTLIGELVISRSRLQDLARKSRDPKLVEAVLNASRLIGHLQQEITTARMVPVGQAFERFERLVRDTAHTLGKQVIFEIRGAEIEVDKSVLDEIGEPVMHLLRNSLDHGVEKPSERRLAGKPAAARLTLSAERDRTAVVIHVSDDGRGVDMHSVLERAAAAGLVDESRGELSDAEILSLIARPGFSTTSRVTEISGRGVGLDVVATRVRALGGSVELSTSPGAGTTIRLELPTTLAIIHALLARTGGEVYALPITHVVETLVVSPGMSRNEGGREMLAVRNALIPAVRLRERLGYAPRETHAAHAVVLDLPGGRMGLVVDEFIGQQEIVVKSFDAARGMAQMFSGATILTDGSPALILDAQGIA